jgi:hypothetical protein
MHIRAIAMAVSLAMLGQAPAAGADANSDADAKVFAKADIFSTATAPSNARGPASATAPADANASAKKPKDVINELLDMPAYPPDWRKAVTPWSADRVPPDDAPIELLLAYWSDWAHPFMDDVPYPRPTAIIQARLLEAVARKPLRFGEYKHVLPETPEACAKLKAVYDKLGLIKFPAYQPASKPTAMLSAATQPASDPYGPPTPEEANEQLRDEIHNWLLPRSLCFRDELIKAAINMTALPGGGGGGGAGGIFDTDESGWADAAEALARLDWQTAEPILKKHAADSPTTSAAIALVLLYQHAVKAGDQSGADKLRLRLRALVQAPNSPEHAKDRAVEALIASAWQGRDEWVVSLLSPPPRLGDGVLHKALAADPNHWIPVLTKLVDGKDSMTRDNAIACLVPPDSIFATGWGVTSPFRPRKDAMKPLLPWLSDPNWSKAPNRARLVDELSMADLPESVPGLMWIMRHEDGLMRVKAAKALGHYRAKEAGPELWKMFESEESFALRESIDLTDWVKAMLACSAISDEQIAKAIEADARETVAFCHEYSASGGTGIVSAPRPCPEWRTVQMGGELKHLASDRDGAAALLLARAAAIRDKEPRIAEAIMDSLGYSRSPAIDKELARLLSKTPDLPTVLCALTRYERMRKNAPQELAEMVRAGGLAAGLAAAILADPESCRRILRGDDRPAQLMLLAGARRIRTALPLDDVVALWKSDDAPLALAVEQYLECEDSLAARKIVWAHHPNEIRILGSRVAFGDTYPEEYNDIERRLTKEMQAKDTPDEIIALFRISLGGPPGQWADGPVGQWTVRRKDGKWTVTMDSTRTAKWTRELTQEERKYLSAMIDQGKFEDLPALAPNGCDTDSYEYLHLTRHTGRRVYMEYPGRRGSAATPYDLLVRFFKDMEP